jgi:hypothetical protein
MVSGKIPNRAHDVVYYGDDRNNLLRIYMIGLLPMVIRIVFVPFMNCTVVSVYRSKLHGKLRGEHEQYAFYSYHYRPDGTT